MRKGDKKSHSLLKKLDDGPVSGPFAHGFTTAGKQKRTDFNPVVSARKGAVHPTATSTDDVMVTPLESAFDSEDHFAPIRMLPCEDIFSQQPDLHSDSLYSVQLPSLADIIEFGGSAIPTKDKKVSLLGKDEIEKAIDIETFKATQAEASAEKKSRWSEEMFAQIGSLKRYGSGRITLCIGDYSFDLHNSEIGLGTQVWAFDTDYGQVIDLGEVRGGLVGSLDVSSLVSKLSLD